MSVLESVTGQTSPLCKRFGWLLLIIGGLAITVQSRADSDNEIRQRIGSGVIATGQQLSNSERCQECHGVTGLSGDPRIPHHAGQYADYLIKQLADFQSGARQHEVMTVMAADLTAGDRADIAAYFASQAPSTERGNINHPLGAQLFRLGDPARQLSACAECHGNEGQGRIDKGIVYPRLAGQRKNYLYRQLINWRLGERHNSPNHVMNDIAQQLTDDEMRALVDYLSGS